MTKKVSPKKEADLQSTPPAGISSRLFGIIKCILAVLLLPFVYAVSLAFLNEFALLEKALQDYFWRGVIVFLIIYLFVWEPAVIYLKGQRILEIVFTFLKPLVRVAPYLLPIYAIVLFIAYQVLSLVSKRPDLISYFLFFFGFSIGLHLVFGAKTLRSKQGDFLKSNYIFGFSCIYILSVVLVAFVLNFIFAKFSLVNFVNSSYRIAEDVFSAVFKQLFLR